MEQASPLSCVLLCLAGICVAQRYNGFSYGGGSNNNRNPACMTPNQERGVCVAIENCTPLFTMLSQNPSPEFIKYLRDSNCGFQGRSPKVCCASNTNTGNNGNPTVTQQPDRPSTNPQSHPALRLLPDPIECGESYSERIFGGEETDLGEYPWNVMLLYRDRQTGSTKSMCGGALINKRYVVTAAHCIYGVPRKYKLTAVVIGEHDTDTDPDCKVDDSGKQECAAPKQEIGIEEAIMHPDYKPSSRDQFHDIGIIRLQRDITFQGYLTNPICFPREEMLTKSYVGVTAIVAGWGKTENASGSSVKLDVKVPVVTNQECAEVYKQKQRPIGSGQICAGGVKGKDSCRGDSGGPLMVADRLQRIENSDGRFYLLGVVSFGPDPCGEKNWPGVYTLVSKYASWILDQLKP